MRVTKAVRSFIEDEVSKRLEPKYAADKKEAERQIAEKKDFLDRCATAAQKAYNKYWEEHFHEVSSFCEDGREGLNFHPYAYTNVLPIKKCRSEDNVHQWTSRKGTEERKIAEKIVVELELGGTKKELMELLDKIGKE